MEYIVNIAEIIIFVFMFLAYKSLNSSGKEVSSKGFIYLSYGFLYQCVSIFVGILSGLIGILVLEDSMDYYSELVISIPYMAVVMLSAIYFVRGYNQLKIEKNA